MLNISRYLECWKLSTVSLSLNRSCLSAPPARPWRRTCRAHVGRWQLTGKLKEDAISPSESALGRRGSCPPMSGLPPTTMPFITLIFIMIKMIFWKKKKKRWFSGSWPQRVLSKGTFDQFTQNGLWGWCQGCQVTLRDKKRPLELGSSSNSCFAISCLCNAEWATYTAWGLVSSSITRDVMLDWNEVSWENGDPGQNFMSSQGTRTLLYWSTFCSYQIAWKLRVTWPYRDTKALKPIDPGGHTHLQDLSLTVCKAIFQQGPGSCS